ncbi:MAG: undecaprenyl-diphosphate phosphatase [Parvularculaceae bacterium]
MLLEQLIILALIQGLTEFLPISSSAHLILAPVFLPWGDQGPMIDVAAHLGSLGAVLLYFRRDTGALFRGGVDALRFRPSPERKLFLQLAVATIPLLMVGVVIAAFVGEASLRSVAIIGWTSIIFAGLLYVADIYAPRRLTLGDLTWKRVLILGAAQALAAIPGASRAGTTITAARALGFSRPEAARFSMLMAIPAILAASGYYALDLWQTGEWGRARDAIIVAGLSFFSAYAAIFLFMRMLQHMSMTPFVIYRILLGVGLLAYVYA